MDFSIPPTPSYKKNYKELERIYKTALMRIAQQLKAVDPDNLISQELFQSQINQLAFLVNELNRESEKWIETTLSAVYLEASAGALVTLGVAENLTQAKGNIGFTQMSKQRLEAIVADTFQDVLKATTFMDNNLKTHVREVQAEVIRVAIAQQRASRDIGGELRTELSRRGFSRSLVDEHWVGIIDARGNRWDLTTYTQMVARTKVQQTQIEGVTQMVLEHNDNDLAIISAHGAKDACRHFENMIISLTGLTKGYPTLDEVRASGLIFHPNCQHTVHAIPDIEILPKQLRADAEKAHATAMDAISRADEIRRIENKAYYQRNKK